jgi:hypothetical protein
MSKQALARTFAILVNVSALVAGTAAADAHGMGMGHPMGNGPSTISLTQIKTTNLSQTNKTDNMSSVSRDRRRFRFISVGATYVTPTTTCFYKHTIWGLAKICPDVDVVD